MLLNKNLVKLLFGFLFILASCATNPATTVSSKSDSARVPASSVCQPPNKANLCNYEEVHLICCLPVSNLSSNQCVMAARAAKENPQTPLREGCQLVESQAKSSSEGTYTPPRHDWKNYAVTEVANKAECGYDANTEHYQDCSPVNKMVPDYKSVSNAVNAPLMFSSSDKKTAQAVTPLVLGGAVPSSTASTNVPKKTTVQDAPAPTGPQCDSEHYNATDFPGAHIKWFGFYHTSSTGVTTPGLADSNGVNDSRNTVRTMKAQQIPFNMTWTQEGTVDQLIARIQEAHDLDLKIIVEVTPLFYDQPQAGVFYLKPGNNKPKVTCLGAGTGPQAISADTKDQYWSTPEWDDFVTKLKGANLEDTILAFYPLDEPFNHNSDWTTEVQNLEAIADRIRLDFPDVTRFPIATTFALDKVLNSKFRLPRNFTWFSFDQYGGPWDHQVAAGLGVKLGISNANLGHMIEIFEGKVLGTKKRSCDGSGTTFNDDPLIRTFLTLDAFSFNGPKVPETPLVDEGEFQRLWLKDRQTYMYGVCKPRVVGIIPFMYPSVRGHDTLTGVKDLQGTSGKLIDEYTTFIGKNIVDLYQKHKNDPAKTTYDP